MKIIRHPNSPTARGKYRGYTVELRTLHEGEKSSQDLRKEIGGLKTDDEILRFVIEQGAARISLDPSKPGFHNAIATLLHFRTIEFLGDHRPFVLCHYFDIVRHIFTPSQAMNEQNIVGLPGAKMLQFHSVLTRIRSVIRLTHPARLERLQPDLDPSLAWPAFASEIFKGLEYLAKLYYLKNDQRNAKKSFVDFLETFSSLSQSLREALWEFRCGIVHNETLYNHTSRGVYRFGVKTLGIRLPAIVHGKTLENTFLEGEKFLINLRGLAELMEEAQKFVFRDMTTQIEKYVLSDEFYIWIGRSWNLQYIPSSTEMGNMIEERKTEVLLIDDAPLSMRGEMVIVEYEAYVLSRYIAAIFPRLALIWRRFAKPKWRKLVSSTSKMRST